MNFEESCTIGYRFYMMREAAKARNKYIPTFDELKILIPKNMLCPICSEKMTWRSCQGPRKDVITLQHNNDGGIILICYSCNCSHGKSSLGDEIFNISSDNRYCPVCKQILNKNKFSKNKTKKHGVSNVCKNCINRKRRQKRNELKIDGRCIECKEIRSNKSKCKCDNCLKKSRKNWHKSKGKVNG